MSCSDVLASASLTATGQAKEATGTNDLGRTRVKGLYFVATTAGTLTFRDGGASGTVKLTLAVPIGSDNIVFGEDGLLFKTNVHVTLTTAVLSGLSLFYTG